MIPQVIVTLSPQGNLQAELPGPNGSRRKVELKLGHEVETLVRVLQDQANRQAVPGIGLDGAPTQAQTDHWAAHAVFPVETCAFCRADAKALSEGTKRARRNRVDTRPVVLAEHGGVVVRRIKAKARQRSETKRTAEELGL